MGLPTVMGWSNHEAGWRNAPDEVHARVADVHRAYGSADPAEAAAVLDRYHVQYVIVGPLEREAYPPNVLDKFRGFMNTVYDQNGVTIYERKPSGNRPALP